jgi:hypothetical protein
MSSHATPGQKAYDGFPIKLLDILRRTTAFPHEIHTLGAFWCPDGRHFLVNKHFLGPSLHIPTASVPGRFRAHGFAIDRVRDPESYTPVGIHLPDPQSWRKVSHQSGDFDRTLINLVPRQIEPIGLPNGSPAVTSPGQNPPAPPQLFRFGSHGECAARLIVHTAGRPPDAAATWHEDFLEIAAGDWARIFGKRLEVPTGDFVPVLLSEASCPVPSAIEACFRALLRVSPNCRRSVSFDDYLILMLRFGPVARLRESIEGLLAIERFGQPFEEFASWFRPHFAEAEAKKQMREAGAWIWLIGLSPIHNEFALHFYATEAFDPFVCPIRYNGLADGANVYWVMWKDGTPVSRASLKELLVDGIGLSVDDALGSPPERRTGVLRQQPTGQSAAEREQRPSIEEASDS